MSKPRNIYSLDSLNKNLLLAAKINRFLDKVIDNEIYKYKIESELRGVQSKRMVQFRESVINDDKILVELFYEKGPIYFYSHNYIFLVFDIDQTSYNNFYLEIICQLSSKTETKNLKQCKTIILFL